MQDMLHTMSAKPMIVSGGEAGTTLAVFLTRRLKVSGKQAKRLLDGRSVFVNQRRVWMARHALAKGDEVEVAGAPSPARGAEIPILFRDADYVIVNKPAGLLSNGPGSVELRLRAQLGVPALQAIHRLDRDTTGCLWLALHAAARGKAIRLFESRSLLKTYHALVRGQMTQGEFTISRPLDGQPAVTHVMVLDTQPAASHVKLRLDTGRTHQVRKHMAALHHPLLGDTAYSAAREPHAALRMIRRQMLHAAALAFTHPETGAPVRVQAPLPEDFRKTLQALKLT